MLEQIRSGIKGNEARVSCLRRSPETKRPPGAYLGNAASDHGIAARLEALLESSKSNLNAVGVFETGAYVCLAVPLEEMSPDGNYTIREEARPFGRETSVWSTRL